MRQRNISSFESIEIDNNQVTRTAISLNMVVLLFSP